jgi:hypothetical protein
MIGREALPVNFPQGSSMHRPMPVADLAVFVAMSIPMKDSLSHGAFLPDPGLNVALGLLRQILCACVSGPSS